VFSARRRTARGEHPYGSFSVDPLTDDSRLSKGTRLVRPRPRRASDAEHCFWNRFQVHSGPEDRMELNPKPTITTVAERAGVAVSTVSRVLNGNTWGVGADACAR
jgi:hypothetical protein